MDCPEMVAHQPATEEPISATGYGSYSARVQILGSPDPNDTRNPHPAQALPSPLDARGERISESEDAAFDFGNIASSIEYPAAEVIPPEAVPLVSEVIPSVDSTPGTDVLERSEADDFVDRCNPLVASWRAVLVAFCISIPLVVAAAGGWYATPKLSHSDARESVASNLPDLSRETKEPTQEVSAILRMPATSRDNDVGSSATFPIALGLNTVASTRQQASQDPTSETRGTGSAATPSASTLQSFGPGQGAATSMPEQLEPDQAMFVSEKEDNPQKISSILISSSDLNKRDKVPPPQVQPVKAFSGQVELRISSDDVSTKTSTSHKTVKLVSEMASTDINPGEKHAINKQEPTVGPTLSSALSIPLLAKPTGLLISPEEAQLVARADTLLSSGDIAGARLLLSRAMELGSVHATRRLAETYDPKVLLSWRVRGLRGDQAKATELYGRASHMMSSSETR